jgi:A/G-specific adenine glycosylase
METMKALQGKLLAWYRKNRRTHLPWRKTRDPYAIWVSETMLQQTQVAKVIPFYEQFLKKFPTVWTLADAPLSDVFDSWSGLGYYSRARNLHAAAQKIVQEQGGSIPSEVDQLMQLPGIGRYTAGAVASIAYDRPAPILDGNVIRVLCRYFGIREDPRTPPVQRSLWQLSAQLVPTDAPGDFNQSLMELGALICTPRSPQCTICPLKRGCIARTLKQQEKIPLRRGPIPRRGFRRWLQNHFFSASDLAPGFFTQRALGESAW